MLPIFQSPSKEFSLMQTQWASQLNPLLTQPTSNAILLKDVNVLSGSNVINHKLGRTPQGWVVVDQTSSATFYRSAIQTPLTLTLTASADSVISLLVF